MAKTKQDLLDELKKVARKVFNNIKPEEVTKADIEKLIDAAAGDSGSDPDGPQSPDPDPAADPAAPEADTAPPADDTNEAEGPGSDPADPPRLAITDRHFEQWGVKEDDEELVALAMVGYNLSPDDVLVVKFQGPKEVKIITVDARKCEFIDCRPTG